MCWLSQLPRSLLGISPHDVPSALEAPLLPGALLTAWEVTRSSRLPLSSRLQGAGPRSLWTLADLEPPGCAGVCSGWKAALLARPRRRPHFCRRLERGPETEVSLEWG